MERAERTHSAPVYLQRQCIFRMSVTEEQPKPGVTCHSGPHFCLKAKKKPEITALHRNLRKEFQKYSCILRKLVGGALFSCYLPCVCSPLSSRGAGHPAGAGSVGPFQHNHAGILWKMRTPRADAHRHSSSVPPLPTASHTTGLCASGRPGEFPCVSPCYLLRFKATEPHSNFALSAGTER